MVIFWTFETTQEGEGEKKSDLIWEQLAVTLASTTSDPEINLVAVFPFPFFFVDESIISSAS